MIEDNTNGQEGVYTYNGIKYHKSRVTYEMITDNIKDVNVIFDVGCYDGGDSVRFKYWFPDSQVHAFEASTELYKNMKRQPDIFYNNYIVCDSEGEKDFNIIKLNGKVYAASSIYEVSDHFKNCFSSLEISGKEKVKCITIDSYCEINNIQQIDFMQVDVEGASVDVLMGMKNIKPKLIYLEKENNDKYINNKKESINDILTARGYTLVEEFSSDVLYKL